MIWGALSGVIEVERHVVKSIRSFALVRILLWHDAGGTGQNQPGAVLGAKVHH